jgi:hypothetical protein
MATFAMCQDSKGRTFFVNVDLVRTVEQRQGYTNVEFDNNHSISISGPPSVITNAALGDRQAK